MGILDHELVPKHEVLSPKEKKELLERLGIELAQLPYIYDSDAAVKEIKAKLGDLIKVTRKSPTAGESIYYRVVVTP